MNKPFEIILVGLAFILLLSGCESEVADRPLTFHGQIRNGGTDPREPLKDTWVKIRYYGEGLSLISADSVITGESGSYFFQMPNNRNIKQYSIIIKDAYFFVCSSFMEPVISDFVLPKDINREKINADTLDACVTGKVRLVFTKSNLTSKDTLIVTPKIKMGSFTFIKNPTTVYADTVLSDCFFAEKVASVDYYFELKKESGEMSTWVTSESIEAGETKEQIVQF